MTRIINLRQFIKQKQRQERAAKATQNAALHGRTKEQKKAERASKERLNSHLDGVKRSDS